MPAREVAGTIASPGYASGPLHLLETGAARYAPSGDAAVEAERLANAIGDAAAAVAGLMATADPDSAAILEFQVAMLEDDSLAEPAFAAIAAGEDAATAWTAAMAAHIAGYEAADDSYFRARSADLADIRDSVLRALAGVAHGDLAAPAGAVLYGRDITPTRFLATDWQQGGAILLTEGSPASHVAMLARSRGVPMLVGLGHLDATAGDLVLVDAEHGRVTVLPDTEAQHEFLTASTAYRRALAIARSRARDAATTARGERVDMLVNIAEPVDVDAIDIATCDGVGLMRTEFLFTRGLPGEQAQYEAYRRVLAWAAGKPVTIRTVDAGGDKPVPGYTVEEANPFLGQRGIRLSLARPDVFRVQVRALLRAAVLGELKVMFPMVTLVEEYRAAAAIFSQEAQALADAGIPHRMPPLGIMVEVPAVAIDPAPFAGVAFFSIGSNDLTQYVMAAGRDSGAVNHLADVRHPAVLSLIRNVARFGREKAIPVSLCGDAGGDPAVIPLLIGAGLRALSVAAAQLPLAKAAVATVGTGDSADAAR